MTIGVFFPSLMGVGIIISGTLLVSDWLRKLFPKGSVRRKHNVVVGTYGAVGDAIDAARYSPPPVRRCPFGPGPGSSTMSLACSTAVHGPSASGMASRPRCCCSRRFASSSPWCTAHSPGR